MKSLATLLLVILAVFTGVTAANADDDELWPSYPCFTGSLRAAESTVTPVADLPPFVTVQVPGSMDCDVPDPDARYGVATYGLGGFGEIHGTAIRPYTTPTGRTDFTVVKILSEGTGLCLMPTSHNRISCVRLLRVNDVLTVVPVSQKDRFFNRPVELLDDQPSPGCPSCW